MKTITIKQPWASLIVEGIKDVENRTWKTNFRGRILIHAGIEKTSGLIAKYLSHEQHIEFRKKVGYSGLDFLEPTGAIIGSVEIVDCVINHPSIWAEKTHFVSKTFYDKCIYTDKDWAFDIKENLVLKKDITYNWVLANPIKFPEPIPCKGKLSFWDYPNILSEPEEKDGPLFCHCQLPVKEINQVTGDSRLGLYCRYCGGKWYK